jgi:ABC-type molybdate transport system ATPase subunit
MSTPPGYVSHDAEEVTHLATTQYELAHGKIFSQANAT